MLRHGSVINFLRNFKSGGQRFVAAGNADILKRSVVSPLGSHVKPNVRHSAKMTHSGCYGFATTCKSFSTTCRIKNLFSSKRVDFGNSQVLPETTFAFGAYHIVQAQFRDHNYKSNFTLSHTRPTNIPTSTTTSPGTSVRAINAQIRPGNDGQYRNCSPRVLSDVPQSRSTLKLMPHNTVNRLNLRHLLSKNVNVNYPEAYGRICRCYHSHSDGTEFELHPNTFNSPEKTRKFVKKLRSKQRALLLTEIQTLNQELNQDDQNMLLPPSRAQLRLVALNNAVPFVGFGFLDNAIMIIAGDYIDWRLGALFGISTLAAAGLGNLISDLAGVVLAGYVDAFAAKFGIPSPNLSLEQYDMRGSKIASALGRCIGIALGCLLGMFPLFFLKTESKEETDSTEEHQE